MLKAAETNKQANTEANGSQAGAMFSAGKQCWAWSSEKLLDAMPRCLLAGRQSKRSVVAAVVAVVVLASGDPEAALAVLKGSATSSIRQPPPPPPPPPASASWRAGHCELPSRASAPRPTPRISITTGCRWVGGSGVGSGDGYHCQPAIMATLLSDNSKCSPSSKPRQLAGAWAESFWPLNNAGLSSLQIMGETEVGGKNTLSCFRWMGLEKFSRSMTKSLVYSKV